MRLQRKIRQEPGTKTVKRTFYELRYLDSWGFWESLWQETSKKVAMIRFRAALKRCPEYRLVKVTETTIPHIPNK